MIILQKISCTTGNGAEIVSYNDYVNDPVKPLKGFLEVTIPATTCPLVQHIPGDLNLSPEGYPFVYKAQQDIYVSCHIKSLAETIFKAGDGIVFEAGFQVDAGGSALFLTNQTLVCP